MALDQLSRLKTQSVRYRATALTEAREGHWERVEELLWASVVAAVKGVALSRDVKLHDEAGVRRYVTLVAEETGDRGLADVLDQVSRISTVHLQVQDASISWDNLYNLVRRVCRAVERLWRLIPLEEGGQDGIPIQD